MPGSQEFSAAREAGAHPAIQRRLAKLRQVIESQGLTFRVGYTAALDRPVAELVGGRPPQDMATQIESQNQLAGKLLEVDKAARQDFTSRCGEEFLLPELLIKSKCVATNKSFDWRKVGAVTPVRQQQCSSCWAYSSMAALESSYRIRNALTIDGSEQYIISCATYAKGEDAGSCSGGWHSNVFDYMISNGIATEASLPDTGTDGTCDPSLPTPYRAVAWGWVPMPAPAVGFTESLPNVDALKQALCDHGPLTVGVLSTGLFTGYTGGVFKENVPKDVLTPVEPPEGISIPVKRESPKRSYAINHEVLIIGWDDRKGAWLIKNSWGTDWGEPAGYGIERGYMWIAYESNNIGYGAAWIEAQNTAYVLPPRYFELIKVKPFPDPGTRRFEDMFENPASRK